MNETSIKVPCSILAGGKAKPDMLALTGEENRAMVVVQGKRLLDRVVDALRGAPRIGEIAVVGGVPPSASYRQIPDCGGFVENVFASLEPALDAPYLLIATADLPFLTPENVAEFVDSALEIAQQTGATILYPIVPVANCYAAYPNVKRTSLKIREGAFTGGNLMLVNPAALKAQRQRIADAYAARKSPVRLALMLGLGTVFRLALSQLASPKLLTLPFLESRVSRLLGTTARAVICNNPAIATDLDRPSDFEAVGLEPPRKGEDLT